MKRQGWIAVGAIALGGLLAGAGLGAYASSDPFDGSELVDDLGRPGQATDTLPASVPLDDFADGGLVGTTSRLLGTDGASSYWVALDGAGDLCLIASFGENGEMFASTCGRPAEVDQGGLLLGFQSGSDPATEAYLVPDGAQVDGLPGSWIRVDDNLISGPADDLAAGSATVEQADGRSFQLGS